MDVTTATEEETFIPIVDLNLAPSTLEPTNDGQSQRQLFVELVELSCPLFLCE
jgi:hypothetical protein